MTDELKKIRRHLKPEQEGDIAPALLENIQDEFERLYKADKQVQQLVAKITGGTATHMETQAYAVRIGELSSDAMIKILAPNALLDGRMYWNVAQRTILPTMENNHKLVTLAADEVELALRKEAGIGIKPAKTHMDKKRIKALLDKAASTEDFSKVAYVLGEPAKNATQSFADDYIKTQAGQLKDWGMEPRITRTTVGKCCDWCRSLAGAWVYGEEPKEIYQRHDHCRCAVTYDPRTGRIQNAHTKKWRPKW